MKKVFGLIKGNIKFLLILIVFVLVNVLITSNTLGDSSITVITNNVRENKSENIKLIKSQKVEKEFVSKKNNLGTISVKFNTHSKINTDFLQFRIREKDSNNWFYTANYKVDQFQNNQYFPFGFPIVENSKNKSYVFEITSLYGTEDNMVSVITDSFLAKYSFPKSYLMENKNQIPSFLVNKLISYINNIGLINHLLSFIFALFLYLVIKFSGFFEKKVVINNNIKSKVLYNSLNDFLSYIKNNLTIQFLLFFVLIASYGFELSNFTLSIDEEYSLSGGITPAAWISQGRFGIGLLKILFNSSIIVPFWNTFLAVLFLFIGVVYTCYVINIYLSKLNISESLRKFLIFILGASFISFPTNSAYISFSTYNFEVSVGILLTAIATKFFLEYIFENKNIKSFLFSILFLFFALSIYQSFITLFLCIVSFVFIVGIIENKYIDNNLKNNINKILSLTLVVVISIVSYKLIDVLFSIKYPSMGYIEGFVRWGKRSFDDNYNSIIYFYKTQIFSNKELFFYIPTFFAYFLSIFLVIFNLFKNKNKLILILWSILFYLSPMLLSVLLGSETPIRTMQSVAFMSGALFVLIILVFRKYVFVNILIFIAIIIIFLQTQQIAKIFYSDHLRYQSDIKTADRIVDRIHALGIDNLSEFPIVFIGSLPYEQKVGNIKMETLGYSFFEWDNGSQSRIIAFFKANNYKLNSVNFKLVESYIDDGNNMPSWPNTDSVQIKNGVIVVKLSSK